MKQIIDFTNKNSKRLVDDEKQKLKKNDKMENLNEVEFKCFIGIVVKI
jgi:hypothetical protein